MKPYKLASREFRAEDSLVSINGIEIGGRRIVVMAGPCAVESEQQLVAAARAVKATRASINRATFLFIGLSLDKCLITIDTC